LVGALAGRKIASLAHEPLIDAIVLMEAQQTRQLAVIDNEVSRRVVGILALSDVMRAQALAVARDDHADGVEVLPR
jgi:CBS domain-containing protein